MRRLVTDKHGNPWEVRSRVDWNGRAAPPFEVDETDPRSAGAVLGVLTLLVLVVLVAIPPGLLFPGWAPAVLVLAAVVGLLWWGLRRSWVVAAVDLARDREPGTGSSWSRSVRGAWPAWRYHSAVATTLRTSGQPDPDLLHPGRR